MVKYSDYKSKKYVHRNECLGGMENQREKFRLGGGLQFLRAFLLCCCKIGACSGMDY